MSLSSSRASFALRLVLLSGILVWPLPFWLPPVAQTQLAVPKSASPAAQNEVPKDPLGRTTPRGTVLGFLNAARKGNNERAAEYLNTRLRGKAAADLAHQLFVVLDRRLPPRIHELSDSPEGSQWDPLRPNLDLVGSIESAGSEVDIFVERLDRGESGFLWLFSDKTLEAIPTLYDEINVLPVDEALPSFLVDTRIAGIALFEWLAVFVGMPLIYWFTGKLIALVNRLVAWLRHLYRPTLVDSEFLPSPIRLFLLAATIRLLLYRLGLSLLARQFWLSVATAITIVACVWLSILLNGRAEECLCRRLRNRNLTGAASIVRLGRRAIDLVIILVGVFVALYHWGIRPTAALAGLGVGGIAVALAAQKTLENVIGGMSLIFDRAVRVGDFLKVGNALGTVEQIGLRSVRIRTLDRSVISIPNGQISNMSLETLSSRDKFWFHPVLGLKYGTSSRQILALLDEIRNILVHDVVVEPDSIRVRFLGFGTSSLDIEIFAYALARDWNQFLKIQEALLLQIMECIESAGVQIALPSQAIFLATTFSSDKRGEREFLKASALDEKPRDEAAAVRRK